MGKHFIMPFNYFNTELYSHELCCIWNILSIEDMLYFRHGKKLKEKLGKNHVYTNRNNHGVV